jgi:phenylpropionate dioxygenase-like ring-hydroxylating dioxygenase large terminal subunit
MLSAELNQILTDVMPGSHMHDLMGRYWLPVLLSRDLPEPDSDPRRVTIIGKNMVAFRDTAGTVGLLDEHCCHRSASLCLGRVEEGGIRCLYHGWKFDAEGRALDLPNIANKKLLEKVRQRAYPVREAGGIVWAYLGPRELEPAFPDHEFFHLPPENVFADIIVFSANFTRVLEAVLDSSHVGILHQTYAGELRSDMKSTVTPHLEVEETEFGFHYAAVRPTPEHPEGPVGVRLHAFSYPSNVYMTSSYPPAPDLKALSRSMMVSVPVDNDRTHYFMIFWSPHFELARGEICEGLRRSQGINDEAMDRFGLSRETHDLSDRPNRANNYLQDRRAMRAGESFTGLYPFLQEDSAVVSSMPPITLDRVDYMLQPDIAVSTYRRLMIENALGSRQGHEPAGLIAKRRPRAVRAQIADQPSWKDVFEVLERH